MSLRPRLAGRLGLVAGIAAALMAAAPGAGAPGGDDFGRWERELRRCRVVGGVGPRAGTVGAGCRLVRLDQQMAGLLTVRFLEPAGPGRPFDRQLVFAGVLADGSAALRCHDGRCEPLWPLQLRVSAVGEAGYGAGGLHTGLPRAQLARGDCQLEARSFRCQATGSTGWQWQVLAAP